MIIFKTGYYFFTNKNNHNCEYANWLDYSKNCYLVFGGGYDENVSYANRPFYTKDSMDIYFCNKVEFCYENVNCQNSYKLSFGENCNNCVDSCLMYDCKNCSDCFGCVGLRNKQHCIFNVEYSKEEYEQKIKELNQGSSKSLENAKKTFEKLKLTYPRKFANVINVQNTTGDFILDAKNCQYIFDCADGKNENSKFGFWVGAGMKDMYDGVACGVRGELLYESVSTAVAVARVYFSIQIRESQDIYYSIDCHNSSNLFGCVALRNKKYCILNNQYTKEEYEKLVPEIIKQMNEMPYRDAKGRTFMYGEFFPLPISPFCYNETIAQEYFPINKEQALAQGYGWKDMEERNYKLEIKSADIPDDIKDVKDEIVGKVIECEHKGDCNEQCTEAFKITTEELIFHRRMNVPLPHVCPNCRHYQRLKQRNPLNLWHRKCMRESCPNEFETTYAPERPEIIYCEKCYQQEVY